MKHVTPAMTAITLLLLAAIIGCSSKSSLPKGPEAVASAIEVEVAPAERTAIRATLDLVGTLKPIRGATIVSDVDGVIQSFPASNRSLQLEEGGQTVAIALGLDIGHEVAEGDELVQIDPTDFELDLKLAQANLELAKKDLADQLAWRREEEDDRMKAAGREAQAAHEHAKANLRRSAELLKNETIRQGEYETAVLATQTAEAVVAQADAAWRLYVAGPTPEKIAVTEARVAAAEAQVDQRQEKLNKTTIRAPYDAVICNRWVGVGDRVTAMPRVEVMQLIDPRVLMAEIAVPERYQGKVALDDIAMISAAGVPQPVAGKVDLINVMIDPETRTFRVRISIDNRTRLLKPGGFVHVALSIASASDALAVPVGAVTFTEGLPAVFVCDQDHVKKTPVSLGISNRDQYEVLTGLAPGQMVVVGRTSLLSDGLSVRPKLAGREAMGLPPKQAEHVGSELREALRVSTAPKGDRWGVATRDPGRSLEGVSAIEGGR